VRRSLTIDRGELLADDAAALVALLKDFDSVFQVIYTDDEGPTNRAVEWALASGLEENIAPELLARRSLSDAQVDDLVAERTAAKRQRNFARADEIRNMLAEKGILIEDSKDGVRWKRK